MATADLPVSLSSKRHSQVTPEEFLVASWHEQVETDARQAIAAYRRIESVSNPWEALNCDSAINGAWVPKS
jgi:hypothetical protein